MKPKIFTVMLLPFLTIDGKLSNQVKGQKFISQRKLKIIFKNDQKKRKAIYETNMIKRGLKKFYDINGKWVYALNKTNAERKLGKPVV